MKIIGLYSGKVKSIGPRNESTGIYKYPVKRAKVDKLGIVDDIQVDKRFHGGPERALHQYSHLSYEKIIKGYPLLHRVALPGSMGENISVLNMHESNVCIGDIYQMGTCKVQISGPRMPCWKIAAKFNWKGLEKFVAKHAIHGWYYRVLEGGELSLDDEVKLLERPNPNMSVARFLRVVQNKTSDQATVEQAINALGLDPEWHEKLQRMHA